MKSWHIIEGTTFKWGGCVLILKKKIFKCKSKKITEPAEHNIFFEVSMVEFDVVREMFYCWDFIELQLQKTIIYLKKNLNIILDKAVKTYKRK